MFVHTYRFTIPHLCAAISGLICLLASSCVLKSGYTPAQANFGYFEGKGTGQVGGAVHPDQLAISGNTAYAISSKTFFQGSASIGDSFLRKKRRPINAAIEAQYGRYWQRNQQCITASIGGGTGLSSIVQSMRAISAFNYATVVAQAGFTNQSGPVRWHFGLSYRVMTPYRSLVFLSAGGESVQSFRNLISDRFIPIGSAHIGWSTRINKSVRLQMNYGFTFQSFDYGLFDNKDLSAGIIMDIGNISRPEKPPRVKKTKYKRPEKNKRTSDGINPKNLEDAP
jgi:hypothetical protein